MREIILTRLADSIAWVETDLLPSDLNNADEVFICNSVMGIWPVRKIECLQIPVGAVTRALQQKLQNLVAYEAR